MKQNINKKMKLCIVACILASCIIALEAGVVLGTQNYTQVNSITKYNGIIGTYDSFETKGNCTLNVIITDNLYIKGVLIKDSKIMNINLACLPHPVGPFIKPGLFVGTIGGYSCIGDVDFHGDNNHLIFGTLCFNDETFWYSGVLV